jgi:hypothetical protein
MKKRRIRFQSGTFLSIALAITLLLFLTPKAQAIPSVLATYEEINLGGGLWEYDYTLTNTSDPVADAGFNVYDFTLNFNPSATLTSMTGPSNWDIFSDSSSFIYWFSLIPGARPIGSDIAPGAALSGFNFTSDARLASLTFDVTITNPSNPEYPVVISDVSSPETTAVPEPATVLLLGSGLVSLGFIKRKISISFSVI